MGLRYPAGIWEGGVGVGVRRGPPFLTKAFSNALINFKSSTSCFSRPSLETDVSPRGGERSGVKRANNLPGEKLKAGRRKGKNVAEGWTAGPLPLSDR